ncbi:hypothetical protein Aduo_005453 [Ancylostoma duodenale]
MEEELFPKYQYTKLSFCAACDSLLSSWNSFCSNDACEMRGIPPKRSRNVRRTTMHLVQLKPQLELALRQNIDLLLSVHHRIHWGERDELRPETSDFRQYREDIERPDDYVRHRLNVVLTLNFDGVKLKKLSRNEAWPVYLRIEGLPSGEKDKPNNILLPAIMFIAKTPTEHLLRELFFRLKRELAELNDAGLMIRDSTDTEWRCFPKIMNGVIDFSACKILYTIPRWNSQYGCHLCTVSGERTGRSQSWYVRFPRRSDRRTPASLFHDASLRQHGLTCTTQMMDLLTPDRCHPDALHVVSAGITVDFIREMTTTSNRIPSLRIPRAAVVALGKALERTQCHTHASRFILGLDELSRMTASEKDEV